MCQWLALNSEFEVCFACPAVRSRAGLFAGDDPVGIIRLGDWFCPKKMPDEFHRKYAASCSKEMLERRFAIIRFVNNHSKELAERYRMWLGRIMLEELTNEE